MTLDMKKTRGFIKDYRKESIDTSTDEEGIFIRHLVHGLSLHRLAGYFIAQTQQLGAKDNQRSRNFSFQDQLQRDGLLGTEQAPQRFRIQRKIFQDSKMVIGCLLYDDKGVH